MVFKAHVISFHLQGYIPKFRKITQPRRPDLSPGFSWFKGICSWKMKKGIPDWKIVHEIVPIWSWIYGYPEPTVLSRTSHHVSKFPARLQSGVSHSIISPHGARAHERSWVLVCWINCANLENSVLRRKGKCWGRQKCPVKLHNLTAAL